MMSFDAVLRLVRDLAAGDLEHWIEERWVLPESDQAGYLFREIDVARVHLIVELRRDLAIDEEAMPVVLRLLDQVYHLRRRLKMLSEAVAAQPPELRQAILARLAAEPPED
jgi:chaperone modulatory protein CbpM